MNREVIKNHIAFLQERSGMLAAAFVFGVASCIVSIAIYAANREFQIDTIFQGVFGGLTQRIIMMSLLLTLAILPLSGKLLTILKFFYDTLIAGLSFMAGFWLILVLALLFLGVPEGFNNTLLSGSLSILLICVAFLLIGPFTFHPFKEVHSMDWGKYKAKIYFGWFFLFIGLTIWAFFFVGRVG